MAREPNGSTPAARVDDVLRIAAIADPIVRNLEITYSYSLLAAAVTGRIGEGANWCSYATWASRQAGRTIRGEDLAEQIERSFAEGRWVLHPFVTLWRRLLRRGILRRDTRLGRLTAELHTPFDAVERASDAVARGNLKVFEEIGLEFARYLDCPQEPNSPELREFLERLRPGDPPEGQRYLRQAFTRYERRRLESDPKASMELAVLANLEIGFHEQTRLQEQIREALDAASDTKEDLGRRALEAVFPSAVHLPKAVKRPIAAAVGVVAGRLRRASNRLAREVITDSFMVMSLPGRTLALGRNLPDEYPEPLRDPADPELVELLARYEPVPPAPDDCGARDWSDLDQRMHYLVHLFCSLHRWEELAQPPFTDGQVATLIGGELPDGEL